MGVTPNQAQQRTERPPIDHRGQIPITGTQGHQSGRPAVISFVTVAELGYGARLAGWGPGKLRRLEYEIARAEIVWPGPHLVEAYASLRTWCVQTGHGLGQKEHEADRWVAATAIWLQVPLVAHDRIFNNVKDLELLTKLGD